MAANKFESRKKIAVGYIALLSALSLYSAYIALGVGGPKDPTLLLPQVEETKRFNRIYERYGGFRTVLLGMESDNILTAESIGFIKRLTDSISKIPEVEWALSFTNILNIEAGEEDAKIAPLFTTPPRSASEVETIKQKILKNPQIIGELVSHDLKAALIIISLRKEAKDIPLPSITKGLDISIVQKIGDMLSSLPQSGIRVHLYGAPVAETLFVKNSKKLVLPGIFAALIFIMLLILSLKSFADILLWLFLFVPPSLVCVALPSLLGVPVAEMNSLVLLPALIYALFITLSFLRSLELRLYPLFAGCAFLSLLPTPLLFSAVPLVRSLAISLALLPLLFALLSPVSVSFAAALLGKRLERLAERSEERKKAPIPLIYLPHLTILIALVSLILFPFPKASVYARDFLGGDSTLGRAAEFLDKHFSGSEYITIAAKGDLTNPAFLKYLDEFSQELRNIFGVSRVTSPADVFKTVNEAMTGRHRIPDTSGGVENLWFFLDGQPQLNSIIHKREECLMQARLSSKVLPKASEILAKIEARTADLPKAAYMQDIRRLPLDSAKAILKQRLDKYLADLCCSLGRKAKREEIRVKLSIFTPLDLPPIEESERDGEFNAKFKEVFREKLFALFNDYFQSDEAPVSLEPKQIETLVGIFIEKPERVGGESEKFFSALLPENPKKAAKLAGVVISKAMDAQVKTLANLIIAETGSGDDDEQKKSRLLAFISELTSPYIAMPAGEAETRNGKATALSFEITGLPALAPIIEAHTHKDFQSLFILLMILSILLAIINVIFRKNRVKSDFVIILSIYSALSFQLFWLLLSVKSLSHILLAAACIPLFFAFGAWISTEAGAVYSRRKIILYSLLFFAPLAVVAAQDLKPIADLMSLTAAGLLGAAIPFIISTGNQDKTTAIYRKESRDA
ncbi:MAG: hypothetical protein Kow0090_06480 [Myxococcota bacterium]